MAGASVAAGSSGTSRRYPGRTPAVAPAPTGARSAVRGRRYGGAIPTAALLSFRLGGSDGVAVEAAKWRRALEELGFTTYTVAGSGPVDVTLPGLAIDAPEAPSAREVDGAVADADLVVVENLCSLPLNPAAADVVASVLAGRPAVLHHHDLPWQRPQFGGHRPPPDHPRWRHVTINELSRGELAERGIRATTVYNSFAVPTGDGGTPPARDRRSPTAGAVRDALGAGPGDRVVLQPTRALARKNVAGGLAASHHLHATYWLLGPAEDGYGPELDRLVADAPGPVVLGAPGSPDGGGGGGGARGGVGSGAASGAGSGAGVGQVGGVGIEDAYGACDVVALPSTWEGFGNPSVESATHRRPLVVGPYPVARELAAFGFDWFGLDDLDRLDAWLAAPSDALLEHNLAVARAHFSLDGLPGRIAAVLPDLG